jgi:3-hydroxybutyrate dehydrogenase
LLQYLCFNKDEAAQKIMLEPMPKEAFIDIAELPASPEFLISNVARNITAQTIVIDDG